MTLAMFVFAALRAALPEIGPGDPAARMLPLATVVVNFGEAGTLNVNEPGDLERARRLTRPAP